MLMNIVRPVTMVSINAVVGVGLNQIVMEELLENHPNVFTKKVVLPDGEIGRIPSKIKRMAVTVGVASAAAVVGIATAVVVDALVFGTGEVSEDMEEIPDETE